MDTAHRWRQPSYWKEALGLSPVPLHAHQPDDAAFVLLNGAHGNFCLDVTGEAVDDGRSAAWSADVGHFVELRKDLVTVQHWNRLEKLPSRFIAKDVLDNLPAFHAYLENNEPNRDQSVIAHALRVIGQMRVMLGAEASSDRVMSHFLALLDLSANPDGTRAPQSGEMLWLDGAETWDDGLREWDWEALRFSLTQRMVVSGLKPEIDLLLRHASGALFQEVYHSISIPLQAQTLPGIPPPPPKRSSEKSGREAGTFFTPPALARTLVEEALGALSSLPPKLRIFDPACGSSEFLKEAIRQLEARKYNGEVELIAWDILDASVQMSRFSLSLEAKTPRSFTFTFTVEKRDSLDPAAWPSDVSVLLMNPPFRSLPLMTEQERQRVQEILGSAGRPNLAAAFVMRASQCVADGGVLAFIAPASVSEGHFSKRVREALAEQYSPILLAKLGNQSVFTNATVDAGIYVGIRRSPEADRVPARVVWADQGQASLSSALRNLRKLSNSPLRLEVVNQKHYSIYPDRAIGRSGDTWSIKPYHSVELLQRFAHLPRLGELFDIKQGARIGNDVFIQPQSYVLSLPQDEQRYFRPAVMNSTLRNSVLIRKLSCWYPHGPGLAFETEDQLVEKVPTFYETHLKSAKQALLKRNASQERWWELIWPRTWQFLPEPKIVTTYFGDKGSVAFDAVGDFVVVVGHCWRPRKVLGELSETVAYAYVALAASDTFSSLLNAVSVHVGGGQLNLESKHLDQLPIIDLTLPKIPPALIRSLASFGQRLSQGKELDASELDGLVLQLYAC